MKLTLQTSTTITTTAAIIKEEIENGLDFILSHFDQDRQQLFPRKIQTSKSEARQIEVFSKQDALFYFKQSNFIDCKINAFPSYTVYHGIQRYPPDLIFIDIDRSNFKDDKSFENALSKTKRNIKEKFNSFPTVNWSGNGYHIIQPIECPIVLEQIEQFQKYKNKNNFFVSQEFLRFAKNSLSNGKADKNNYPSFKSCLLRIPQSINSKYNKKVTIVQKWNGIKPPLPRELLEDFRTYLIQKKINENEQRQKIILLKLKERQNKNATTTRNYYEWIDKKILANLFPDCRKIIVNLILAPYLINIKRLSYEESYQIIREWLDKFNSLQKLDNYRNFVEYRISYALKNVASKPQIGPMSLVKIKTDSRYSNNLYLLILQK